MMYTINVEGTRKVVDACLSRGLRLVHTSSHHALVREPLDEPLTEDKPARADREVSVPPIQSDR